MQAFLDVVIADPNSKFTKETLVCMFCGRDKKEHLQWMIPRLARYPVKDIVLAASGAV
jgi:hypothetical protein